MSPRLRLPAALAASALLTLIAAPGAAAQSSPNGDLAFHAPTFGAFADRHYDIFVQSPGGTPRNVTADSGAWDTNPDWSPDGTRIVFTSNRDGSNEIFVMKADGTGVRQLTSGRDDFDENWGGRWSPDGSRIVYTHDPRMGSLGDTDIYVMDADGTRKRNVTDPHEDLQYDDYAPSWSADGSRLVFGAIRAGVGGGGNYEIVTSNPDGSGQQRLMGAANELWVEYPSFSPVGSKIVYMASDHHGSDWDVWVMNADGSGKENVTQHPAGDDYPTWSNDGTQIFFTSNRDNETSSDMYAIPYPAGGEAAASPRTFRARAASTSVSAAAVAPAQRVQGNVLNPDFALAIPRADRTASLTDSGFVPRTLRTRPGQLVRWTNTGSVWHRVRDGALRLLFSGRLAPGATFDHRFVAAGTYTLRDPSTGATQTVEVYLNAVRRTRGDGRTIALTWGSTTLDETRVYDVQVRKPGATGFTLMTTTGDPAGDYVAPRAGIYEFRARLRRPGVAASGWSPVRTIDVP